ncbi:uncharacterized protein [Miscanthus floridulus]|uniref:uncharacterized protein n=1 Tax=Miscanthus floridulus TaxID=154761 RepID=UPI003457C593
MTRTTHDATRTPEHGATFEEVEQEVLIEEQFNKDLENDLAVMLSQDPFNEEANEIGREEGGEEGRVGEVAGGEEEDDDDDEDEEEAYESPEDPFPPKVRRRPTEEDLDKD